MKLLQPAPAGLSRLKRCTTLPLAVWVVLCSTQVQAEVQHPTTVDEPERVLPPVPSGWMLGLSAANGPSRPGAAGRETSLRPVLAGKLGRWTVSTSSARRLGADGLTGGVSTTVAVSDKWSTGVGLRLTHGRSAGDDPLLQGTPDVKASLAGRLSVSYAVTPVWSVSTQWQQDVLHAQGGRANLGVGARWPMGSGWTLDAGSGVTWLNRRAMQTFYGVPDQAASGGRAAYRPGAGLEQWALSAGTTWSLDRHWRVSAGWTHARLLGAAADSPLTARRGSQSLQITVAYAGW